MRPWLALVLVAACTQPRSARCKHICAREYECQAQVNSAVAFDEKECIAACAVLESDDQNLAKVQQHSECVEKTADCRQALDCP